MGDSRMTARITASTMARIIDKTVSWMVTQTPCDDPFVEDVLAEGGPAVGLVGGRAVEEQRGEDDDDDRRHPPPRVPQRDRIDGGGAGGWRRNVNAHRLNPAISWLRR